MTEQHDNNLVRYERRDIWFGAVMLFALGLVAMGIAVQGASVMLFDVLTERDRHKAPIERSHLPEDLAKVPLPRLQVNEAIDLDKLRREEDTLLNSYGWVDRQAQVVHIPIEEAMKLLADPHKAAAKAVRSRPTKEVGR